MPVLFLMLAALVPVIAQDQPVVHNFGPQRYHASPQNWSVDVTESGIVAGNSSGVLEYDGEHWALWTIPGNHRVRAVFHRKDTIFCGGFGEFGFWLRKPDGTRHYHSLSRDIDYPLTSEEEIWHIESYPGGILFQSFSTIYLYEKGNIRVLTPPFSTGIMFTYWCADELLFQAIGEGIARLDPQSDQFTLIPSGEQLIDQTVIGIVEYLGGGLLATEEGRFYLYDGKRIRPILENLSKQLVQNQLNKMVVSGNDLILGSILDGIFIVDPAGRIQEHINYASGLRDNTILALTSADRGRCWIGMDNGLAYINLQSAFRKYEDQDGELGIVFTAMSREQSLYLGTNHGLFRSAADSGTPKAFTLIPGSQGQVWTLQSIGGDLYCGHNDGTFLVTDAGVRKVCDVTGAWSWLEFIEDKIWIQGTYTGLVIAEKKEGSGVEFRKIAGLGAPIRDLVRDKSGAIWGVAPNRGIYRLLLSADLDSVEVLDQNLPEWNLPDLNRLYLVNIHGKILLRSEAGWHNLDERIQQFLPAYDFRGKELTQEFLQIKELGDLVIGVKEDELTLWNDTSEEVIRVERMPEYPSFCELRDGRILVGSAQGYFVMAPQNLIQTGSPPIRLTAIDILGQKTGLPYPLPDYGKDSTMEILLHASQSGVAVRFTSGFLEQEQVYRYRLDAQGEWSAWTPVAAVTLQLLPFGDNDLYIQRGGDSATITIRIIRDYPWYLKNWAIGLFSLLLIGLAFWSLRKYQMVLERRWKKRQIEQERARHAREIEARNKQLLVDLEEQNQELAGITMNLVRKNEIILELRNDLKQLQKEESPDQQQLRSLVLKLNTALSSEKDWEAFEYHFTRVHQGFFQKLKKEYPVLTASDMRLAAYIRMNLSSKEIAPLLHISLRSVENKRYRLRKKLHLDPEQQIIDVLLRY